MSDQIYPDRGPTERLLAAWRAFRDEVFAMQGDAPSWVVEHGLLAVKLVAQEIALLYQDPPADITIAARFNPRYLCQMQDVMNDWHEEEA